MTLRIVQLAVSVAASLLNGCGGLSTPENMTSRLSGTFTLRVQPAASCRPQLAELYAAARTMGLPAETLISEYAPGQLEVVLRHRPDALQAADEAIQWKRLVRGVAARHGLPAEAVEAGPRSEVHVVAVG